MDLSAMGRIAAPGLPGGEGAGRKFAADSRAAATAAREQAELQELKQADRAVRGHEQAHAAAAGGLARGVSYTWATGPDGRGYVIAGEVSIETEPARSPIQPEPSEAPARSPAAPVSAPDLGGEAAAEDRRRLLDESQQRARAREFEESATVNRAVSRIQFVA